MATPGHDHFERRLAGILAVGMGRREFIALLGGSAIAWPIGALAQQPDRMRRLGVLMAQLANDPVGQKRATALVEGLDSLNWKEGRNLRIDQRWAGGDLALFERYAAELIALGPDVLWAAGTPSTEALHRQTRTIPIVFAFVADPVGQGFVASLAHPGGNITGFSGYDQPMAGKWLDMLTQVTPPVTRVLVLFNPATAPYAGPMMRAVEEAAPSFAVAVRAAAYHDNAEIEVAITGFAREQRAGLLVLPDASTNWYRKVIVDSAARTKLPAIYWDRSFVADGGLMSYGPDIDDVYRRSAGYIDRILKGAKPSDLPVQNPTKFELTINLKTAKALGLTVPPSLLARADEVIE